MKIKHWLAACTALLTLHIGSTAAVAQNFPDKPIRLVIPVPVGGGIDAIARLLAQHLRDELGQPVIVENRPGAGGNIAMAFISNVAPDGYTMGLFPSTPALNHTLYKNLPFNLLKDFQPVALVAHKGPNAIVGRGGLPVSTLRELMDYAKANPGQLSYAGCDTGSSFHLAGELFKKEHQLDITHIAYKGCADVLPNLLGGHIDLALIPLANVDEYVKSGQVKLFAVASDRRTPFVPDAPTTYELGVPLSITAWYGILMPGKTPDAIVDRVNTALNTVLARPALKEGFAQLFVEPAGGTRADFKRLLSSEVEHYAKLIEETQVAISN